MTKSPSDQELMELLDASTESETSGNFIQLEQDFALDDLVPGFERVFPKIRRYGGRMNILFRLVRYARIRPSVVDLAVGALNDKSRIVRYHACATLAYAQDPIRISDLKRLLTHKDAETQHYALAAIDAIESKNHHYFADREHKGNIFWHPVEYHAGS